jgi:endonuclease/exonuclease/phosphatase family metal-dependent hydrolase
MATGFIPPATLLYDDVRLTDYDVVLARGDVQISNVAEVNYESVYAPEELPIIQIPRGYVAVDATVKNRTYRFVNTHLEPADLDVQLEQAEELIDELSGETKPVIVVGDLNTPAPTGETYRLFEMNGYVDTWTRNLEKGEGEGFTNPHDSDLRNAESDLYQRVDLILVRNQAGRSGKTVIGPVFATVWGDEQADRTALQNLWPSDHAAVIAELRVPVLGMPAYK